jgi:hypothetical protein
MTGLTKPILRTAHAVLWTFLIALCAASCSAQDPNADYDSAGGKCVSYFTGTYATAYDMLPREEVDATLVTPEGIHVDPSTNEVSAKAVDCIVDKIERCLLRKFGNPPVIPPNVQKDAMCVDSTFAFPIPRACVTVKVVDDWHWSCDHTDQLLKWTAPDFSGCAQKGEVPVPGCPCSWRSGVQDEHTVVTTPSFYLFPDWFIRVYTGCLDPWASPVLAECATPLTGPLDLTPTCTD